MFSKIQFGLMAGVLALSAGAGLAYAAMSADDAIKMRQACMKQGHGGVMKVAVPMFKGEASFDAAVLKAAFAKQDSLCRDSTMWGADTRKGDKVETHALPEIWTDAKTFAAANKTFLDADQNLRKVVDLTSFKAAFPAFGAACKGCHEKFRAAD